MPRAVKATGDWCAPTAELAAPKLLQLLHSVKTTPDEAELEIVPEEAAPLPAPPVVAPAQMPLADPWFQESGAVAVIAEPDESIPIELEAEIGDHPEVEELSAEDEHAIAEAQNDPLLITPTGAHLPLEKPVVKRPPAPRPAAPSGSVLRTLFAIVIVLGAAAGGVLIAMNVVSA